MNAIRFFNSNPKGLCLSQTLIEIIQVSAFSCSISSSIAGLCLLAILCYTKIWGIASSANFIDIYI